MVSMTGYGSSLVCLDGREIRMEVKSVNHRYMDIAFRIPRFMGFLEDELRRVITGRLVRGHVDVFAVYRNTREDSKLVKVDMALAKAYVGACEEIKRESKLEDDLTLTAVVNMPNVMTVVEGEDDQEAVKSIVLEALDIALSRMCEMREREGISMYDDVRGRIDALERLLGEIKERAPLVTAEYRDKLSARISELTQTQIDETRLATEVAYFADRCAIDEEIVRLESHIGQMRETMSGESGGRKLDFIVQEMNREVNTIASKASDAQLVRVAVEAKSEIEKIREQVQNVV